MGDALADLRRRHSGWEPGLDDRDDFTAWTSDVSGPQGGPEDLASVRTDDLVSEAMRLEKERPFEHGDTWHLFCETEPRRALDGLLAEAGRGEWKPEAWHTFLSSAARVEEGAFHYRVSDALLGVPPDALRRFSGPAASWLQQRFGSLLDDPTVLPNEFLHLWDHLADVTYVASSDADDESEPPDDLVSAALNSPGGLLVWTLCSAISDRKPAQASEFGAAVRRRFDRAIGQATPAGLRARGYLARELPFLFYVDPSWTLRAMVPCLDANTLEGRLLLRARLSGRPPQAPLFYVLKPGLLALANDEGFSTGQADGIAEALMAASIKARTHPDEGWNITPIETRRTLAATTAAVRHRAADILSSWTPVHDLSKRGEHWHQQVGPFFEQVWPRDSKCRDAQTSEKLAGLVLTAGSAFPDAVRNVTPVMVPFPMFSIEIEFGTDGDNGFLIKRFPLDFVVFLNAIIHPDEMHRPRDLDDVLQRCSAADPRVSEQPGYLRLRSLARRKGA
jgi:hypothetical protein